MEPLWHNYYFLLITQIYAECYFIQTLVFPLRNLVQQLLFPADGAELRRMLLHLNLDFSFVELCVSFVELSAITIYLHWIAQISSFNMCVELIPNT